MLKLVYCIRKKAVLSRSEFQQYWLGSHAELVKRQAHKIGAFRYVQSHTLDSVLADTANEVRGSNVSAFDGITEFWWHSEADLVPSKCSREELLAAQKCLLADEHEFINLNQSVIFMTQEYEVYHYDN